MLYIGLSYVLFLQLELHVENDKSSNRKIYRDEVTQTVEQTFLLFCLGYVLYLQLGLHVVIDITQTVKQESQMA